MWQERPGPGSQSHDPYAPPPEGLAGLKAKSQLPWPAWRHWLGRWALLIALLSAVGCWAGYGSVAGERSGLPQLQIAALQGSVDVRRPSDDWRPAYTGQILRVRDSIRTGIRSWADLGFPDGSSVRLDPQTQVTVMALPQWWPGLWLTRGRLERTNPSLGESGSGYAWETGSGAAWRLDGRLDDSLDQGMPVPAWSGLAYSGAGSGQPAGDIWDAVLSPYPSGTASWRKEGGSSTVRQGAGDAATGSGSLVAKGGPGAPAQHGARRAATQAPAATRSATSGSRWHSFDAAGFAVRWPGSNRLTATGVGLGLQPAWRTQWSGKFQSDGAGTASDSSLQLGGPQVIRIRLDLGRVWVHVMKQAESLFRYEIETPSVVAGARGTVFSVSTTPQDSRVSVWEGRVEVRQRSQPAQVADVGAQQEVQVGDEPVARSQSVNPVNGVQRYAVPAVPALPSGSIRAVLRPGKSGSPLLAKGLAQSKGQPALQLGSAQAGAKPSNGPGQAVQTQSAGQPGGSGTGQGVQQRLRVNPLSGEEIQRWQQMKPWVEEELKKELQTKLQTFQWPQQTQSTSVRQLAGEGEQVQAPADPSASGWNLFGSSASGW